MPFNADSLEQTQSPDHVQGHTLVASKTLSKVKEGRISKPAKANGITNRKSSAKTFLQAGLEAGGGMISNFAGVFNAHVETDDQPDALEEKGDENADIIVEEMHDESVGASAQLDGAKPVAKGKSKAPKANKDTAKMAKAAPKPKKTGQMNKPKSSDGPAPEIVSGSEEYEVEEVLDSRRNKRRQNRLEYKVKWVGYEETTWEAKGNMKHTTELVEAFHAANPTKPKTK